MPCQREMLFGVMVMSIPCGTADLREANSRRRDCLRADGRGLRGGCLATDIIFKELKHERGVGLRAWGPGLVQCGC
jgi:hypothetical protein